MKTFEYKGDTLAIIDGELWLKLPISAPPPMPEIGDVTKKRHYKKRGRKPGRTGTLQRIVDHQRRRRTVLGPEAEETIKAEIEAGMKMSEVCKKYEISVSTYYRLKNESQSSPVREGVI